jgi:sugar-specific transcriptional regulator TrmB
MLDLTPFGFTPTETHAYRALLELGPSGGYAVARALSIARANAYQALDGLVAKGAATLVSDVTPRRYRAVQPRSVFALVLGSQTARLDELERQLLTQPAAGSAPLVTLRGERALTDTVVRAIVRTPGEVTLLGAFERLSGIAPALRARAAAGRAVRLWSPTADTDLAVEVGQFEAEEALLLVGDGALAGQLGADAHGIWSEAPLFIGLVRAAIRAVVPTDV